MRLELVLGNDKENDELDREIVERIELDPGAGAAKGGDHLGYSVGRGMRNRNPKADPRAHCFLASAQGGKDNIAVALFDFAKTYKHIDELDNCRPSLGRLHFWNYLINGK